jgi:hypothetical protein
MHLMASRAQVLCGTSIEIEAKVILQDGFVTPNCKALQKVNRTAECTGSYAPGCNTHVAERRRGVLNHQKAVPSASCVPVPQKWELHCNLCRTDD